MSIKKVHVTASDEMQVKHITMDVPLFVRLLEMAANEIETDAELRDMVTRVLRVSQVQNLMTMQEYPLFVVPKSPEEKEATAKVHRKKITAKGPEVPPDMLMQALSSGLNSAVGPLKLLPSRSPGKYETKVFQATPNKVSALLSLLKGLDFSVIKLDNQKVASGVRIEITGKTTYVAYTPLSGMLIISSNADVLDI